MVFAWMPAISIYFDDLDRGPYLPGGNPDVWKKTELSRVGQMVSLPRLIRDISLFGKSTPGGPVDFKGQLLFSHL